LSVNFEGFRMMFPEGFAGRAFTRFWDCLNAATKLDMSGVLSHLSSDLPGLSGDCPFSRINA
jgi:hypothetical protein